MGVLKYTVCELKITSGSKKIVYKFHSDDILINSYKRKTGLRTYAAYEILSSSLRNPNESFKTYLTLVETMKVTKSFLYMKVEDYHFEKKKNHNYLYAGLIE